MEYVISGLVFFLIFTIIILIHEGGHFWAAKIGGIKVLEFGFGLPPKLWGWKNKKSGVEYTVNWIPFGGFVKMHGEDDPSNEKAKRDPDAFNNRPLWARIFAVSAGVMMNVLLAFVLTWVGFVGGMRPFSPLVSPERHTEFVEKGWIELDTTGAFVESVEEGSPAAEVGIETGDYITHIDNTQVTIPNDVTEVKEAGLKGSAFHMRLLRKDPETGGVAKDFVVQILPNEQGNFGVVLSQRILDGTVSLPVGTAFVEAGKEMWILTVGTLDMLGKLVSDMVSEKRIPDEIGGPVRIADVTHDFVQLGDLMMLLQFTALISLSIAIMNILPLPALDGGRLVFLFFELITRRQPSPKWETIIHTGGFLLLMLLLIMISINDVRIIFWG